MEPSLISVFAAGVAALIIGIVWYHPRVFGTAWMKMAHITPEMAERRKDMWIRALIAFIASMIAAYVMSYFGMAWGVFTWPSALQLALWCWIGFTAPAMLGSVLWERKPLNLYFINSLYWLVTFVVMALILLYA